MIFCLLEKIILWIPEHPSVHVTLMWSMVIFVTKTLWDILATTAFNHSEQTCRTESGVFSIAHFK